MNWQLFRAYVIAIVVLSSIDTTYEWYSPTDGLEGRSDWYGEVGLRGGALILANHEFSLLSGSWERPPVVRIRAFAPGVQGEERVVSRSGSNLITCSGAFDASTTPMASSHLKLIDGTLELLTAAVAGDLALEALLGVSVADDWAGFPEALPILRESYAKSSGWQKWGSLFFVEPQAGVLVGFGGFKGPPSSDGVVEIGYAIAPAFQGQGLATDAVAQMVRRAFEAANIRAVDAHTLGHANPSARVLEKSGFRKIGEATDPDAGVVWHWRRERPIT